LRVRLTLLSCGRCGKPRGLHHVCRGGGKGRDRIKPKLSFTCPSCGKATANLLAHTCTSGSDFRKRQAAQKRAEQAAARKRKRRAAAARKRARARERKKAAAERRRRLRAEAAAARARAARAQSHDKNRHEYAGCRDEGCGRSACRIYREGAMTGRAEGHAEGYAEGYAEGMTDAYKAS
jgi:membrane protein involved in colicin uptake